MRLTREQLQTLHNRYAHIRSLRLMHTDQVLNDVLDLLTHCDRVEVELTALRQSLDAVSRECVLLREELNR